MILLLARLSKPGLPQTAKTLMGDPYTSFTFDGVNDGDLDSVSNYTHDSNVTA